MQAPTCISWFQPRVVWGIQPSRSARPSLHKEYRIEWHLQLNQHCSSAPNTSHLNQLSTATHLNIHDAHPLLSIYSSTSICSTPLPSCPTICPHHHVLMPSFCPHHLNTSTISNLIQRFAHTSIIALPQSPFYINLHRLGLCQSI